MANTPYYNPMGLDPQSLIPWLQRIFGIVAQNQGAIQGALGTHSANLLVPGLFGSDASGYGLSMTGTDPNSRELYDPYGTGENNPFYAFRHFMFSPQVRQGLYNQVMGAYADNPWIQNMGREFFATNPDDIGYFWDRGTGANYGYNPGAYTFNPLEGAPGQSSNYAQTSATPTPSAKYLAETAPKSIGYSQFVQNTGLGNKAYQRYRGYLKNRQNYMSNEPGPTYGVTGT